MPSHALPSDADALALAGCRDTEALAQAAAALRDQGHGAVLTYSRKVFLPLTQLCRDVCHYCTFARAPRELPAAFLSIDEVLRVAREGVALGCKEALFTLGERPERRYPAARDALAAMGFDSTVAYLRHAAACVLEETGLLPHLNPGTLSAEELTLLRPVAASMGLMIESSATRLAERGMPHHGSPDKAPARRLRTLHEAGAANIAFTTGLLIGIGETRRERIETLLAIRRAHAEHGHVQEIIVQNFRAKPGTRMAQAPEPSLDDLRWTIAVTRLIFGAAMGVQAPPNLSPGVLPQLVSAGLDDWGGVSPLTPDFVNPEAPWPHLRELARRSAQAGKTLDERLAIRPAFALEPQRWLDPALHAPVLRLRDGCGYARNERWRAGAAAAPPHPADERPAGPDVPTHLRRPGLLVTALDHAAAGRTLDEPDVVRLLQARGADAAAVCRAADDLRRRVCGEAVGYVVNRNINYTNLCVHHCGFCSFSKSASRSGPRDAAYDLDLGEVRRRAVEAVQRGATEVCMQGGIHPGYDGHTYLALLRAVREAAPELHVHAFSPLEVRHGAASLGLAPGPYLQALRSAGLGSLPGTAAEILDDEVRALICPDKLNTAQWFEVMALAHRAGLASTATMMFGHVEAPRHVARHLLGLRAQQQASGGFTEFVPLPFVHQHTPIGRRGLARQGPSFREALLAHAAARLVLHPVLRNIQVSWVKMGPDGARAALAAGANDLGGTLMNESISRSAGACHGQESDVHTMRALIAAAGRLPRQRTTLYADVPVDVQQRALLAPPLLPVINTPLSTRSAGRQRRGPITSGAVQPASVAPPTAALTPAAPLAEQA